MISLSLLSQRLWWNSLFLSFNECILYWSNSLHVIALANKGVDLSHEWNLYIYFFHISRHYLTVCSWRGSLHNLQIGLHLCTPALCPSCKRKGAKSTNLFSIFTIWNLLCPALMVAIYTVKSNRGNTSALWVSECMCALDYESAGRAIYCLPRWVGGCLFSTRSSDFF